MNRRTQESRDASRALLKLESRIAKDERGGGVHRWNYGRDLLDRRTGVDRRGRERTKKLPAGLIELLIKEAARRGLKVSRREIQYRMQCAEAYETEAKLRKALAQFGTWFDLFTAGFPAVEGEEIDPGDVIAAGLGAAPDEYPQLEFDIPGLKPVISVRGRQVPLVRGPDGATIADVAAYLDMCEQMHEGFGKTIAAIRQSLATMRAGADYDDEANAVEAWEAATEDDFEDGRERPIDDEPRPNPPGKPITPPLDPPEGDDT